MCHARNHTKRSVPFAAIANSFPPQTRPQGATLLSFFPAVKLEKLKPSMVLCTSDEHQRTFSTSLSEGVEASAGCNHMPLQNPHVWDPQRGYTT